MCTLIGCSSSLEIALVGDYLPTDFTVRITSPDAGSISVHCIDGSADFDPADASRWSPACPAGGLSLRDFTPVELSTTVSWSEGEVTQDFRPLYSESRPNGPGCEPICRSARLQVLIPSVPPYGDTSTWDTFSDPAHGFKLKFPASFALESGPQVAGHSTVYIGDKIQVRTSSTDPLVCQAECPMIETSESVTLAGRLAHLVRGHLDSDGGVARQDFVLYLVRSGSTYVSLVLYVASSPAPAGDPGLIHPLQQADIDVFNHIVRTLEFTQ